MHHRAERGEVVHDLVSSALCAENRQGRAPNLTGGVKAAQNRQLQAVGGAKEVRIRLLGPVAVALDGRPVTIASKKARALLGYLALREGSEVARGVLTGLLWGERSETHARASLRQALSELRIALRTASAASPLASTEVAPWATP